MYSFQWLTVIPGNNQCDYMCRLYQLMVDSDIIMATILTTDCEFSQDDLIVQAASAKWCCVQILQTLLHHVMHKHSCDYLKSTDLSYQSNRVRKKGTICLLYIMCSVSAVHIIALDLIPLSDILAITVDYGGYITPSWLPFVKWLFHNE